MATDRPLVVLAGPIHPAGRANLETEARVVVCDDETEAGFLSVAADADGLLFRAKPRCTGSLMAACKRLKVVGRHGVGLDTVDIPAATKLGVAVVHAPGSNSQSVAEHALMLMLMSAKRARQVDRWTREGNWSARQGGNSELKGKTLGIVGIGNIGRLVATFAGALGMRVLAYDPYVADGEIRTRGAEPVKSLEALLPQVDVLTTHTPLTDETRGMINDKTLGLMKRGAIFVNTSRGGVQQEREVRADIRSGKLTSVTAGLGEGYVQANLAVLPKEYAYDFMLFCQRNPRACPLIEVTDVGSPEPTGVAPGADLRTDLPRYRIYKDGVLADEVTDATPYWRDDLVAFLLGCSFTFEWALLEAGIDLWHVKQIGRAHV